MLILFFAFIPIEIDTPATSIKVAVFFNVSILLSLYTTVLVHTNLVFEQGLPCSVCSAVC